MPDNPELIEKHELELWHIIYEMHKDGINYSTILFLLQEAVKNLDLMAYCEKWLALYATDKGLVAETK